MKVLTKEQLGSYLAADKRGLAEWEQAVKNGQKSAEKQHRPFERQSVRNRLRQLQAEGKLNSQPKQRKKSQDRDR